MTLCRRGRRMERHPPLSRSMTPPFKAGDRQVWQGRPHAPSNPLAYGGRKRAFLYAGAVLSLILALLISGGADELENGYSAGLVAVTLFPFLVGLGLFLVFALSERSLRRQIRYGVTSRLAIIQKPGGTLRYEIQPDDPIVRRGGSVSFNDGRVKRVWESERTATQRQSELKKMHPDAFAGLTEAEAEQAEAALLAAREAARARTARAEAA